MESQWWDETNQNCLFPCGSHIPPSLQFTRFKFISSRQLCSGRNDLRRLILEKRASCQWFHYTLCTGSSSANMNCLRVLILPPPTSAVGFYRPTASQSQLIKRAREVRATQGGSYTTTHRVGPWFLGRSPPLQTVIFSPAFAGPSWLSRFLALCLNYAGYFVG